MKWFQNCNSLLIVFMSSFGFSHSYIIIIVILYLLKYNLLVELIFGICFEYFSEWKHSVSSILKNSSFFCLRWIIKSLFEKIIFAFTGYYVGANQTWYDDYLSSHLNIKYCIFKLTIESSWYEVKMANK